MTEKSNEFSGGLFGSYPTRKGCIVVTKGPIKGNEHLHQEVEVEEVYHTKTPKDNRVLDRYTKRKEESLKVILSELEKLTEVPMDKWTGNEEGMAYDILGAIENTIKAKRSEADPSFTG